VIVAIFPIERNVSILNASSSVSGANKIVSRDGKTTITALKFWMSVCGERLD